MKHFFQLSHVIIAGLFLINVVLIIVIERQKEVISDQSRLLEHQQAMSTKTIGSLNEIITRNYQIQLDHQAARAKDLIKGLDGAYLPMAEVIGTGTKVVFRFSQTNCQACIDFMLPRAVEFIKEVGRENVIFLGNFFSSEALRTFNKFHPEISPIYDVESLGIQMEKSNAAYYFTVDSTLNIRNVFLPDEKHPDLIDFHLRLLKRTYFKEG